MGNAVGPVTLIAIGIFLGYLVLTNRTKNLVATLMGTGSSSTTTTTPSPNDTSGTSWNNALDVGSITFSQSGNDGTGIDRSNPGTPGVHTYTVPIQSAN